MSELISIIVPVYKVEAYLSRCVDSIVAQTYKNLDIILVDDGSPDNSGKICDEYAEKDNRITVIHQANGGLSDARNAGIAVAKGSYLTFLDIDDWVPPEYIAYLYDLLKETGSAISLCNFLKTTTEELPQVTEPEMVTVMKNDAILAKYIDLGDDFHPQLVMACGKLFEASLFETIRFPVGRLHEDEFTTYKLFHFAPQTVLSKKPLYYYWQREDSIMGETGFRLQNKLDYMDALAERAAFFHEVGRPALSDRTYKSLFSEALSVNLQLDERKETEAKAAVMQKLLKAHDELKRTGRAKLSLLYGSYLKFETPIAWAYRTYKN
jgi:glycosyltransferase involved in cell wall biosynthesis